MDTKEVYGFLSALFTLAGFVVYCVSMVKNESKPHIFSRLIWVITVGIAFAAQYSGGSGSGSWAAGSTFVSCLIILVASFFKGSKDITRSDVLALSVALLAIVAWQVTKNPFAAIALVTFIDAVAYYPTLRKSISSPYEEPAMAYVFSNCKHVLSIFAIEHYSWTTVLYSAVLFVMNFIVIVLLMVQRSKIKKRSPNYELA